MKTREEVEALKAQWLKDPCWDIEDTGGFEEYATELAGFRVKHEALVRAVREKVEREAYRNSPASEMTMRDVFAAGALLGLVRAFTDQYPQTTSKQAYEIADAMMEARRA